MKVLGQPEQCTTLRGGIGTGRDSDNKLKMPSTDSTRAVPGPISVPKSADKSVRSGDIPPLSARNIENTGRRSENLKTNTDSCPRAMSARLEAQKKEFHAQATVKFPAWNHDAETFLNTLQETNTKKGSLKGLDSYLLTYLEKMKEEAEAESEGSAAADKRKSPAKKKGTSDPKESAKQPSDPKPSAAKKLVADPLLETVDAGVGARAAADDENAQEKDGSDKEASDKVASEVSGLRDGDLLLKPDGDVDEAALNVEAVEHAEKRERSARVKAIAKRLDPVADPKPKPKPKPAKETTESDEDEQLVTKSLSKTPRAKPSNKKRKKSEDPIEVDSQSEDEKDKKGRFKTKDKSQILTEFEAEIKLIRPLSQQMMLARDGIESNATSPARLLNMQTVLQAAQQKLDEKDFKQFRNALLTSYDNKHDQ